jgi:hypothetical protein
LIGASSGADIVGGVSTTVCSTGLMGSVAFSKGLPHFMQNLYSGSFWVPQFKQYINTSPQQRK